MVIRVSCVEQGEGKCTWQCSGAPSPLRFGHATVLAVKGGFLQGLSVGCKSSVQVEVCQANAPFIPQRLLSVSGMLPLGVKAPVSGL